MEKMERKVLPLNSAYPFAREHGLQEEVEEIRNMEVEWELSYNSDVRRGYIVELFRRKSFLDSFMQLHWPSGKSSWGERECGHYLKVKDRYEEFLLDRNIEIREVSDDEEEGQQFLAESDLRNVLAANLECIEPGLRLFKEGERDGVEYPIQSGRIDILAVDNDNRFVVIELKLSRGREKAVGTLLYYIGWVDRNLGRGPCRGMIVAKEMSDEITLAVQRLPDVSLLRYRLSMSVETMEPIAGSNSA